MEAELSVLTMIANRRRPGIRSCKSSKCLPARSVCCTDKPVTLPPGRARLATMPVPSGSAAAVKTIGMTDVACFVASTIGFAYVTMTSTFSRTNSAANSAARSLLPSAQRYSTVRLRPSIQPSSRSLCKKAVTQGPWAADVPEPKNPMIRRFPISCARAASGQTAAPPSSVMNSRRLVCRKRSIVRGDEGRIMIRPSSRPEAPIRLGCQTANELGAPVDSSIPVQLPGHEAGVGADLAISISHTAAIAHQAARRSERAELVDRGHNVAQRQCGKQFAPADKKSVGANHERTSSHFDQRRKGHVNLWIAACMQDMELQAEVPSRRLHVS